MEVIVKQQMPLPIANLPRFAFDNYLTGENAELLFRLKNLSPIESSHKKPIFIYCGDEAVGKSHLLHASYQKIQSQGYNTTFLDLNSLVDYPPMILEQMEQLDVIFIDHLDAIVGKREWEVALFDLINKVLEREKGLIVLTSRTIPALTEFSLPDLKSRLMWGDTIKIVPLNNDDKQAYFMMKAKERGFKLTEDVTKYLINRIARDTKTLNTWLDKLDEVSLQEKRKLTIPLLKQLLDIV
ncbi:MAG: DnaA regulatory inactivator Hda [Alteromonadaceae bacterium]|nr:DnaA regulatory inactivator Hda [Alteromonadaceae bacterium]